GVITGEVIADTTARAAPDESAAAVGSLRPGEEVVILGQTRAQDWLLVNASLGDGIWVRRAAIQAHDSLDFVPIADPTPVPDTPTPTVDESPTETPTPDANLPDLAPAGVEVSGTVLRVTISNSGGTAYSGGLVVSVAGVDAGTLSQAFSVDIPAGGSTVVEFALSSPITEERQAEVSVDPDNAVLESAEDNNAGVFVVAPSVETASLAIVNVVLQPGTVAVAVFNDGGDLPLSTVTVTVSVGGQATQLSVDIAIPGGATEFFEVQAPSGSGVATITVLVDGAAVASAQVTIPGDEPEPTETETAEPTAAATEEQ
ncbi:MAG TPA: CARDB domain-containing protein, partial [Acidimicrobiia bacterium]|nr:CARDB domain-containing protein [Acidimicrobiia bacterium]